MTDWAEQLCGHDFMVSVKDRRGCLHFYSFRSRAVQTICTLLLRGELKNVGDRKHTRFSGNASSLT